MMPLPPELPITVTLSAAEWNIVLGALHEAPFRLVSATIARIMRQIAPAAPRGDGAPPETALDG